jgi:hypothetical protein
MSTGYHAQTSVGIWSLRFVMADHPGYGTFDIIAYGGENSSQPGARASISRWPGEFHDDGRPNTAEYCDFGAYTTSMGFDGVTSVDPAQTKCQLLTSTVYYVNVTVPYIDARGNESVFGWFTSF